MGLTYNRQSYLSGPNATELNTVDVWVPDSLPLAPRDGLTWVIYVHGGAWRDPEISSSSFEPAVTAIWNSLLKGSIAGFASINYRLSSYLSHPKMPSSPDDPSRNVHYPSHLLDVSHALIYLEEHYQIEKSYLLVGHSAGATMTLQLHNWYMPSSPIPSPLGVLGVSGIYHFDAFIEAHSGIPAYRELMENAFPDKGLWERACPYTSHLPGPATWELAKAIFISHSNQDELVESKQASFMLERIRKTPQFKERAHFLEATGTHDDIWRSGDILAGLISRSLRILHSVSALPIDAKSKSVSESERS